MIVVATGLAQLIAIGADAAVAGSGANPVAPAAPAAVVVLGPLGTGDRGEDGALEFPPGVELAEFLNRLVEVNGGCVSGKCVTKK